MKKLFLLQLLFMAAVSYIYAQDKAVSPAAVIKGTFLGISPPLRELPPMSEHEISLMKEKAQERANEVEQGENGSESLPQFPPERDGALQNFNGNLGKSPSTYINTEGLSSFYFPSDANGAAGKDHYMQAVNSTYGIFNKNGEMTIGPVALNTLFTGLPGSSCNDGDPVIIYDETAERWLAAEFSICGTNDYMLVAVSSGSDPGGTWYRYSFDVADIPDYEKFGVWPDGYYMATNTPEGNDIYVLQRSVMLNGGPNPLLMAFDNPLPPPSNFFSFIPPVDNDGTPAPTGAPGMFIGFYDNSYSGGNDQLWIYQLTANWSSPLSSTFLRSQQLNVPSFTSNFSSGAPQPGTIVKLDLLSNVIMNLPEYRNFGNYQSIVCCHTVNVDDHAGIRWYELLKTGSTPWTVRQTGTYSPDSNFRWMGSVKMNSYGRIAIAYSVSGNSLYPGIRFTGQSASAYNNAGGIMDFPEGTIFSGQYSQTLSARWGDYSALTVDPVDNTTFWFTTQYCGPGSSRKSRVATFSIGAVPEAITSAASEISGSSARLNGILNPNGGTAAYHFEWGTTSQYGNNTVITAIGGPPGNINVFADIANLAPGSTYHYRMVASSADGVSMGEDKTFTASIFNVNPVQQSVPPGFGVTYFCVSSETSWTTANNSNWCFVNSIGQGSDTAFVMYLSNDSEFPRTAELTFTDLNNTQQTVYVNQDASPVGSIDLRQQDNFVVFPNPNQGDFTIFLPLGYEGYRIEIFENSGRKVYEKEISGSGDYNYLRTGLAKGSYQLKISGISRTYFNKLIIK